MTYVGNSYHQLLASEAIKKIAVTKECRKRCCWENVLDDKGWQGFLGHHTCDNSAAKRTYNNCEILPIEKMFNFTNVYSEQEINSDETKYCESWDEKLDDLIRVIKTGVIGDVFSGPPTLQSYWHWTKRDPGCNHNDI